MAIPSSAVYFTAPGADCELHLEDNTIIVCTYEWSNFHDINKKFSEPSKEVTDYVRHIFKLKDGKKPQIWCANFRVVPSGNLQGKGNLQAIPLSYIGLKYPKGVESTPIPIMQIVGLPLVYSATPLKPSPALMQSPAQTMFTASVSIALPSGMAVSKAPQSGMAVSKAPPSEMAVSKAPPSEMAAAEVSNTKRDVDDAFKRLLAIGDEAIRADFEFCCSKFTDFQIGDKCKFQIKQIEPLQMTPVREKKIEDFKKYWGEDRNHKVSLVYHGTSGTGRKAIIDQAVVEIGHRGVFGVGAYFGTDPLTAMRYNTDGDDRITPGSPSTVLLVCAVISKSFNHQELDEGRKRPKNFIITNGDDGSVLPMFLVTYNESNLFDNKGKTEWEDGPEPFYGKYPKQIRLLPGYDVTSELGGTRHKRRRPINRKAPTSRKRSRK